VKIARRLFPSQVRYPGTLPWHYQLPSESPFAQPPAQGSSSFLELSSPRPIVLLTLRVISHYFPPARPTFIPLSIDSWIVGVRFWSPINLPFSRCSDLRNLSLISLNVSFHFLSRHLRRRGRVSSFPAAPSVFVCRCSVSRLFSPGRPVLFFAVTCYGFLGTVRADMPQTIFLY